MKAFIEYNLPGRSFWDAYAVLWDKSRGRSVFKAPLYLQFLANLYEKDFAVYKYYKGDDLMGASFFRKKGSIHHLITDVKSDFNFFILHNACTERDIQLFFENLFIEIRKHNWAVILNNQPAWADYRNAFLHAAENSGLFYEIEPYSKCLILEKESPEALLETLSSSKEVNRKTNKLIREKGAEFEVFTAEEDLEAWTKGFCDLHVQRWKDTTTPSRYGTAESVKFLEDCLKIWSREKSLARFSIKLGHARIAYVICLTEGKTLIHHMTAYDPEYQKYGPGRALILKIGQWMYEHGLSVLNFGEGMESYKYGYINKELELSRVFISRRLNLPFIIQSNYQRFIRKQIRKNPKIRKVYYEKILPLAQKVRQKST